MKHQKIKLVLSLDRLNVEVSKKMKKKIFQQFLRFQDHFLSFLSFLENRIFFKNQAFLHAAPMIFVILSSKATKKKKNLKFYPTAVYRWGHLTKQFFNYHKVMLRAKKRYILPVLGLK
jgi:hypothetical protein